MKAGEIGAERCARNIVQPGDERALRGGRDDRLKRGKNALAVGLPERHKTHACGNQIGGDSVQVSVHSGISRNAVP
jgi:hypothetical protein